MKRNGNIAIVMTIIVVAIISGATWYTQRKPDYVQDAMTRVSSYLGNYYGPTECSGRVVHDGQWKLSCTIAKKGKSFGFSVMPAENAPYPVSRTFYLKADDVNSEEVAQFGLMKYLQIDTNIKG
ncbi:hypothetical protein N4235_21815 [Enterobacter asburiae]|uniref:hypothetical protein n=1 Tax=Enterobacter asburiae TaxID=61645 RepID=UPI002965F9C4|nr:hypothetical protein [Enterobacter asburiae]MDW3573512.1 hypothetical protein [Enterobacter asburiae]